MNKTLIVVLLTLGAISLCAGFKEEYDQLIKDSDFLTALHEAGVDNWDGYSFAQELYEEEIPKDK